MACALATLPVLSSPGTSTWQKNGKYSWAGGTQANHSLLDRCLVETSATELGLGSWAKWGSQKWAASSGLWVLRESSVVTMEAHLCTNQFAVWFVFQRNKALSGKDPTCRCRRHRRCRFSPWVRKIPLEKEMATHPSILAWRIPWTEESGYSPCGLKEWDTLKRLSAHSHLCEP